jgi:hypothetical protein
MLLRFERRGLLCNESHMSEEKDDVRRLGQLLDDTVKIMKDSIALLEFYPRGHQISSRRLAGDNSPGGI